MSGVRSMCRQLCERHCLNLTDVTLADQANNSIQADNANMAIHGNVAIKVTQSRGQLSNQCKRRHPMINFELIFNKPENADLNEILRKQINKLRCPYSLSGKMTSN